MRISQLRGNILSGQFDSLGSAAGNAAIVLVPKIGTDGHKNGDGELFKSFADNPFTDCSLLCQLSYLCEVQRR